MGLTELAGWLYLWYGGYTMKIRPTMNVFELKAEMEKISGKTHTVEEARKMIDLLCDLMPSKSGAYDTFCDVSKKEWNWLFSKL